MIETYFNSERAGGLLFIIIGILAIGSAIWSWQHGSFLTWCATPYFTPGIHVDDIEKLLLGFVRKLRGVKSLLIIDPYLYAEGAQSVALFNRMLTSISDSLEEVAILTNGREVANKAAMHDALNALAPSVKIVDRNTDEFHDRCWIDRDRGVGFYMGTSLNGVGKKMCLVDHMRDSDARSVCSLANNLL
jgi:hypothetical protein